MTPSAEGLAPVLRSSFGASARRYFAHARVQQDQAAWLAQWLPEERTGEVLEVGAGPGVFTSYLAPWHGNVVATDLSPQMCEEGARRLPHVVWRSMEAERPLAGPWKWIVSSSALQWVADPLAVFAAWHDVMAKDGRALLAFFVAGTLDEWLQITDSDSPVRWRSVDEWKVCLAQAGWNIRRASTSLRVYSYPSAPLFLRSLHAVGAAPFRRASPGVLKQRLATYARRFPNSGGGVKATWAFFRCEAEVL